MAVKVYIKPLNSCVQRRQNIEKWNNYVRMNPKYELAENIENADEIWVWTCAFREDMKQNSLKYLNKINEKFFGKKIIQGGCMPDISPETAEQYRNECEEKNKNICVVVPWRKEREYFGDDIFTANDTFCEAAFSDDIEKYKKEHPEASVTFCDQFIKVVIAEGCNCKCVYCSERRMFPSYHSFSPITIKDYCKKMIEKTGVYNIVLIADSLGEYGCDMTEKMNLPMLISSILEIDEKVKIALNNLNPQYMILYFEEIKEFILNNKIKHINLPIQSASNKVLKDMNRKYTKQELQRIIDMFHECKFKDYDTHILIGFDGETRSEFLETLEFIVNNKVRYVLASKYMDVQKDKTENEIIKITEKEKDIRVKEAYEKCTNAGIIINCDDSNLNKERMKRIIN